MADIVFVISALVCILSAIFIISQKNPVYSVVFMLPFFLAMTVIFVMLQATFLAAIQMIVYGGAILIVFLFVIMLINLKPEELRDDFAFFPYLFTSISVGVLGALLVLFINHGVTDRMELAFKKDPNVVVEGQIAKVAFGSVESISIPLFKLHMIPFELASVLIV